MNIHQARFAVKTSTDKHIYIYMFQVSLSAHVMCSGTSVKNTQVLQFNAMLALMLETTSEKIMP